ncbi:hypothetical protein [Haloarcula litorea]|uniref:hypothetical protein n=1 Tax=Haloarcula litorea TaxID=3032579 RepID=UPI0023E78245|nr:hypothetical protein [Halomicroarcula sp. GDY20]
MTRDPSDEVVSEFPFSAGDESDERFVCEECGEEFETKRGRNIHAGQVHDE